MKYYTLNSKDATSFILNYEIKDNQIIVNYANGEHYIIPYTNDNEKKILKKMEDQVHDAQNSDDMLKKKIRKAGDWILFSIFMIICNFCTIKSCHSISPLMQNIFIVCFTFNIGFQIFDIKYVTKILKDLEKNKILLDNQEKINEMIKENQNILTNSNEKIKKMVKSTPEDKPVGTLKSVEKLKLKELKSVLENIQKEEEFRFDSSSNNETNDRPLTLSKSIDKNQGHKYNLK
mgnify:CR=1 FL=1